MVQVKLSVYGILFDDVGRILLQKRANTKYAEGWWSLPGGHVDGEESLDEAIRRELGEELGIQEPDCRFRLALARKPETAHRYINFFYAIPKWNGIPTIMDNKASELVFYSKEELPEPLLPYVKEALGLIDQGFQFHESNF